MTELSLEVAAPRRRFTISAAWRQPLAITGAVIAVAWILIAIFAPLIAPYDAACSERRCRRRARRGRTSSARTSSAATSSAA